MTDERSLGYRTLLQIRPSNYGVTRLLVPVEALR